MLRPSSPVPTSCLSLATPCTSSVTGGEAFQCSSAPRINRQAQDRAGGVRINCSVQNLHRHHFQHIRLCFTSARNCSNHALLLQGFGGQDRGGAVPRGRGAHHPGHPGGAALHLHLRGSCQTQGTQQENNVHPGHPAAQPGLLVAQDQGTGERGKGRRAGRAGVLLCFLLLGAVVASSPLSADGNFIATMAGIWTGKVVLLTQCHWFKMQ